MSTIWCLMNTNTKRIIAIVVAFTLGLVLSKNVRAQEPDRVRQLEAEIAQLRAELEQLKSASLPAPEVITPALDGSTTRTLPTPGVVNQGTQQLPNVVLPHIDETAVIQDPSPASIAPALGGQTIAPQSFGAPPTIIRSQPAWIPPVAVEVCPISGVVLPQVEWNFYYRVPPVPRYYGEWDYFDEDRLGRHRYRDW